MEKIRINPCSPNPCGNHVECIGIYNEAYCRCPHKEEYYRLEQLIECKNNDDDGIVIKSSLSNISTQHIPARTSENGIISPIAPTSSRPTTATSVPMHNLGMIAIASLLLGIIVTISVMLRSYWTRRSNNKHNRQGGAQMKDSEISLPAVERRSSDPSGSTISYLLQFIDISKISSYIMISEIFQNSIPLTDVAFVAHLGKEDLAAAALASVWVNIWHFSMMGFLTATDTLLAQSFGAKDKTSFRAWTGTSFFMVLAVTPLVAGLISLCEPAMKLVGQDPNIAKKAGEFSYRLIPGLFPRYLYRVLNRYLQTQNIVQPGAVLGFFSCVFNILSNWLFIFGFLGLGFHGAPWATTATRGAQFLMILGYLSWNNHGMFQMVRLAFSRENLQWERLRHFWKLAISGALASTAISWAFEVLTILAGWLSTTELDAYATTQSIMIFVYLSFARSVGVATAIRVGQLIGGGNGSDARRMVVVSMCLTGGIQTVLICVVLVCKDWLAEHFSNDPDITDLVTALIPTMCLVMLGNSFQAVLGGALRGLGHQRLQLFMNVIGMWVFSIPIGYVLSFVRKIGVIGLWWGMVVAAFVSIMISVLYLKFIIDWQLEERRAQERVSAMSTAGNNMVHNKSTKDAFPRDAESLGEKE